MRGKGDIWPEMAASIAPLTGTNNANLDDLLSRAYFTDCIKCESTENDIKEHRIHTRQFLREELDLVREVKLFVTIGDEAWRTIQEVLEPLSAYSERR
jgi:uracil-DNA glycosylase